ncbi:MAG: hypothetical protein K8S00_03270, partial [Bacteroidales bacterium]|nr:hypothetical protein [Bacteroidales bacterium]
NGSPDQWVNIALAIVTFMAVLVALFQERLRKLWNRSVLDMKLSLLSPDTHQIVMTSQSGEYLGKTIYLRIRVLHKKGVAGENVEIMPINFWRIDESGKSHKLKHFLPISLVWSHFEPRTNAIRVPVGLFRHCDFGHFLNLRGGDKAMLIIDTLTQPNPVANGEIPNVIKPGKYRFELLLAGDNVGSLRKTWEIEFGKWSDSEDEMLKNNIVLKEVK